MKVLYDYQIMLSQKYGGVSRGFCEVASRLQKEYLDDIFFIADGSQNYYLEELFGITAISEKNSFGMDDYKKSNQKRTIENCRSGKYDILHSTWYDPYLYNITGCKHVITIHDMIQEIYPLYFVHKNLVECKKRLIEVADLVIAVSEHTKNDILKIYPHVPEEKVCVVYQGGKIKPNYEPQNLKIPPKYLLYVGVRNNYKNFDRFYIAAEYLMKKYKDLYLICVGGGSFTPFELRMIGEMRDRIFQYNVTESQLAYLYSHAIEFVFPSKYEGFGIPLVEAFSCGCPVVLSNASCFPEIAEDAAVYFDPDNINNMIEKMERVMLDKQLRKKNIEMGIKRATQFSWKNSTKQMHQAYQKVLEM